MHADTREGPTTTTREAGCAAPPPFQTVSLGDNYIRAAHQGTGLSTTATSLICNAWREGTKKQYDSTLRRWREFCCPLEIRPITPHVNDVVEFLAFLYEKGGAVWCAGNWQLRGVPWVTSYASQVYLSWQTIP